MKCVQNPTTEELKEGIYKPRLTVTRRWGGKSFITTLRIEFSAPKLLFGNNFDELTEADFEAIIKRLYSQLDKMGVLVFPEALRTAPVSAVHYSKNIVLTDYSTPSMILEELQKIDLNQRLDLNQTDFRNEGHSLRFRASSFEVSLYDKRKDLQKAKTSEKRAIERDSAIQFELFKQYKTKNPFEVLRMEIRLNKPAKIRQILDKVKASAPVTFAGLFKSVIAQKTLLHYFEEIKRGHLLLTYKPRNGQEFINDFKINNPKTKLRKMLQIYATNKLIEEMGIRKFREATKIYGTHNWGRIKKDYEVHQFPEATFAPLKTIEKELKDFQTLHLRDYLKNN